MPLMGEKICRRPLMYVTRRLLRKTALEERFAHMVGRLQAGGARKRRVVKQGARAIYGLHVAA